MVSFVTVCKHNHAVVLCFVRHSCANYYYAWVQMVNKNQGECDEKDDIK